MTNKQINDIYAQRGVEQRAYEAADRAKRQVKAAILAASVITEAIRELGPIPSGHLYAQVCGLMDLEAYEGIVAMLVRIGLVDRSNHLLTWTGPAKEQP